jgi:hypothetical protein
MSQSEIITERANNMPNQEDRLFQEETQSEIAFTAPLVEKYRPITVSDFIGLERPKAVLNGLISKPRPCNLLLVGPPGSGKTSIALAFTRELKAGLIHLASQKLTVDAVQNVWEKVHYYPESGGMWVVLADEADRMSYQAQVALLSKMDSAATLKPSFGGGFVQGKPLPVIFIFTCNGTGAYGLNVPDTFEKRFVSRCLKIEFDTRSLDSELADYLRVIWDRETDCLPAPDFEKIAEQADGSVRDAVQALELAILSGVIETVPAPQAERLAGITVSVPETVRQIPPQTLWEQLKQDQESFWDRRP